MNALATVDAGPSADSCRASMYDLTIAPLVDGGFELEQRAGGLDEPALIHLHPAQVRLLAECAGLLAAPDPKLLDRMSDRHIGRVRALAERIDELRRLYLDEIIERCGDGIEIALHFRALGDLVDELMYDLGFELVEADNAESVTPALPAPSNEKSAAISVTPPAVKRGRPASGEALSNAERQARHREKLEAPRQSGFLLAEADGGMTDAP